MIYGIIVSAGKETRFKGDKPKTLSLYKGKSFLERNYETLIPLCDRIVVVASHENKDWFNGYDTIVINSGHGCGDAVMKALTSMNVTVEDECFIVWGDCLCEQARVLSFFGEGEKDRIFVPCVWEERPYVSINMNEDGLLDVRFSKYGEVEGPGFHDLGFFYGNCKLILDKLKEFAQKILVKGEYKHKHGNEMQFLDIFNETKVKGVVMPMSCKSISFNSLEELNAL